MVVMVMMMMMMVAMLINTKDPPTSHLLTALFVQPSAPMNAKSLQPRLTLCDPTDCSPPGSSVHGILQVRTLEWVAMLSSRGPSLPRDRTHVSCIGRQILYH